MSAARSFVGPERDPPPFAAGEPLEWNWCIQRTPPDAFEFMGARATAAAWMLPCPACQRGWVGLRPDGRPYGYAIAYEFGCTRDCPSEQIARWHAWRNGALPPPMPDERDRRYALATARGAIRDLARVPPDRDPAKAFARASYRVGQAKALGDLDEEEVVDALLEAGVALGLTPPEAAEIARRNSLAGAAVPLRSLR
jgi:hypothetical protein